MKKIMIGLFVIAIICISSGAYAVLSENTTTDDNINSNDNVSNNIQLNSQDPEQIPVQDDSNIATQTSDSGVSNFVDKKVYVGKYGYYLQSNALDDRYLLCAHCGGFIPIGNVTKLLPDAALCHHFVGTLAPDYQDYSYSYDEAYDIWLDCGEIVFDDGTRDHPDYGDPESLLASNTPYYGDILAQYEECAE